MKHEILGNLKTAFFITLIIFLLKTLIADAQAPVTKIYLPVMFDSGRTVVRPSLEKMSFVPGGEFQQSCEGVCLMSLIYVDPYYIDQYEVSVSQYQDCIDAGPCSPQETSGYTGAPDSAVNHVSWYDASDYCSWQMKRLPTELEWQKAARGDQDARTYPWGNEEPTCELANAALVFDDTPPYEDKCNLSPVSVDSYPEGVSPYNVYNMSGNVAEWTATEFVSNLVVSPVFIIKGGGFASLAEHLRIGDVYYTSPDMTTPSYGFRCAWSE